MNGNPLFGVAVLVVLITVLAAVIGFTVLGTRDTGDYAGSAMDVSFDRGEERVTVMVMDMKGASHVDVTITGWGGTAVVRLGGPGSRVMLSQDGLVVVDGRVLVDESTGVSRDGAFAVRPDDDVLTVHVVGVAPLSEKVLRHETGKI